MIIGFAVLIDFLVIALLTGTIRPTSVVAAKIGVALGCGASPLEEFCTGFKQKKA